MFQLKFHSNFLAYLSFVGFTSPRCSVKFSEWRLVLAFSLFAGHCIVTLNARCKGWNKFFTLSKQRCAVEVQLKSIKGPGEVCWSGTLFDRGWLVKFSCAVCMLKMLCASACTSVEKLRWKRSLRSLEVLLPHLGVVTHWRKGCFVSKASDQVLARGFFWAWATSGVALVFYALAFYMCVVLFFV